MTIASRVMHTNMLDKPCSALIDIKDLKLVLYSISCDLELVPHSIVCDPGLVPHSICVILPSRLDACQLDAGQ